ncbi:TIGR03618 family F420-dependent PPOX class oxidoreductase [Streptomyces misionensis]|uniref:TIGR03618 family F420-dependent PPOX class oxidoreductase n=1 Tax=Streptomyces misionensis TaxID=67331 RepID=A0A5C6JTX3_9ACTN|nr:TIGR03618 family F420-dependent PPOX class oxidoreductase [Streptomyces misionensis]TWV46978.1 TIGR03618 family F420-dependent PPOX class oxidoreductase [Streptomyces misionensis]
MAERLTEQVRRRLEAPNFWFVATVTPDGAPHVTPMWVGLEDGLIAFNTSVGRIKEENLRRDPRVHLSHIDAESPYDRVQISGRAVRFVTGEEAERGMDRLTRKYLGLDGYPWLIEGEQRVHVLVEPERVRHIVGVEPFRPGIIPS